jgi:hypothetical protein
VAEFEDGRVRGTPGPTQPPERRYRLDLDGIATGSLFPRPSVSGTIPFDKSYAQMTAEQQAIVKQDYKALEEGDEPPYPKRGLAPIYSWIKKAQAKVLIEGVLRLDVLVAKDGKPLSVAIIRTPNPDIAKFAAVVVTNEKYKPAVCRGAPCEMIYPFNMEFVME